MAKARDPFDVPFDDEQKKTLGLWLQTEVYNALAAKSSDTKLDQILINSSHKEGT